MGSDFPEDFQMKKNTIRILGILLALLLPALAACGTPHVDTLDEYQEQFGFSLKGIETEVLKETHDHAWDGWHCAFLVKMAGAIEGSDFDPATFREGVSYSTEQLLNMVNQHYRLDNKKSLFLLNRDGHYRSKIWVEKNTARTFTVIYGQDEDVYCCIYKSN